MIVSQKGQPGLLNATTHTTPETEAGEFKFSAPSLLQSEFKISLGDFVKPCLKDFFKKVKKKKKKKKSLGV